MVSRPAMIRGATEDDVPLLAALIRQSFRDVAERYGLTPANCPSHPSFISEANVLEGFQKGGQFWIAEKNTESCGCVGLVPGRSGVYSLVRLAVLPDHRRRGLGSMLVQRVLEEAHRLKLPKVELGIIAAQTDLQRLYERHGFGAVETRRFEHLPFEVTLMAAELAGGAERPCLHPDGRLVEPTLALRDAFLAMASDYHAAGDEGYDAAMVDFDGFVRKLLQGASHENLPLGRVPSSSYWLVDGTKVIGSSRLRHWLVPHLEHEGGHIGYDIRPSERRKGYGRLILALTLLKAKEIGLKRVLVTCDIDNIASARIIERNGGVLENQVTSTRTGKLVSRYWITI